MPGKKHATAAKTAGRVSSEAVRGLQGKRSRYIREGDRIFEGGQRDAPAGKVSRKKTSLGRKKLLGCTKTSTKKSRRGKSDVRKRACAKPGTHPLESKQKVPRRVCSFPGKNV